MRKAFDIFFISFLIYAILLPAGSSAQNNLSVGTGFQKFSQIAANTEDLYKHGMYASAIGLYESNREYLKKYPSDECKAWGYAVLSAVKLQKDNIEGIVSEYAEKYPHSMLLTRISLVMADIDFNKGDYRNCMAILSKIDPERIDISDLNEYYFKKGYSDMASGRQDEALQSFEKVGFGTATEFSQAATYYSADIYFNYGNYKKAFDLYSMLAGEKRFGDMSRYRMIECKMILGDNDFILKEGERIFMSASDNYKEGLARILSGAFASNNDYKWAKYYFDLYSVGKDSLNRKDSYFAAQLFYDLKDYARAIKFYKSAASTKDSLGQYAWYNMGKSQLMLGNKSGAYEAFKMAASSESDPELKEEARFICTKLNFDLNRDNSNMKKLLESSSLTARQRDELYFYIASGYIEKSDYENAIKTLRNIKYPDKQATSTLQKVLFLSGMDFLSRRLYKKAAEQFGDVLKYKGFNSYAETNAQYWIAECDFRLGRYANALSILNELQSDPGFRKSDKFADSFFDSGYCLFKENMYAKSIADFYSYLKLKEIDENSSISGRRRECLLRIADSHYSLEEFEKAALIYEKIAISEKYSDLHIPFQAAVSFGMAGLNDKKKALLYEIVNNGKEGSPYYANAKYELGLSLIQSSKEDEAEKIFNNLANSKEATFRYKALYNLGSINLNRQNYDTALRFYKMVVRENPGSKEASDALMGIENIYQITGNEEEFNNYIDSLQIVGKPENIKRSAKEYFQAGERYSAQGRLSAAADAYYRVILLGEGEFSEQATQNYASVCYSLKRWGDAIKAYETLLQIATNDNNKKEAEIGRMRSFFKAMKYESSAEAAQEILTRYTTDPELVMEAKYIRGKSLVESGKSAEGNKLLMEIPQSLRAAYEKEVKK